MTNSVAQGKPWGVRAWTKRDTGFDFEILSLVARGQHALAAVYAAGSVLLCVACVLAGLRLGRVRTMPGGTAPGVSAG